MKSPHQKAASPAGPAESGGADFGTAMESAGHGKFQVAVLGATSVIYFSSGLQSAMSGYILPSAKCEFRLSLSEMGLLNSSFMIGGMLTCQLWGALSDSVGRRPVLVAGTLLDAFFTLCAVLAPTFPVFFTFRLLSGMMSTAPAALSFLYMGEFLSDKKRGPFIVLLGAFWTLSWIFLPALGWVVIPQPWEVWVAGLRLGSWRFFMSIMLPFNLLSAALAFHFPETPRFLQAAGREEAALAVFQRIFAANTGKSGDLYPVKQLKISASAAALSSSRLLPRLGSVLKSCLELLRAPVLGRTLICTSLYFCNMFIVFGYGYWLPELFNQFLQYGAAHPSARATVCEVLAQDNSNQTSELLEDSESCEGKSAVDPTVFLYTVMVNVASFVLTVLCCWLPKVLGRRTLCALFCAATGLSAIGLLVTASVPELIVVSVLLVGLSDMGCIVINALVVDIFPTRLSGAGVTCVLLSGRLGGAVANVVTGYLLAVSCETPLVLFCVIGLVGGLISCFAHRPFEKSVAAQAEQAPGAAWRGGGLTKLPLTPLEPSTKDV